MMNPTNDRWLPKEQRRRQYLEAPQTDRSFYYGYRKVTGDEKALRIRRHFDAVAPCYNFMNTVLSLGIHYLWKKSAVSALRLGSGQRVLDVCGGTGDLSLHASRCVGPAGMVVLYDMNRKMILAGRPLLARRSSGRRIRFVQGDAEHIAFAEDCFDAAMVGFGIRNVIRVENGLAEMHRVLRPGGRFMCLEFSKPTNPLFRWLYDVYSLHVMPLLGQAIVGLREAYAHLPESIRMFAMPGELSALLENAGFVNVRYRRLTNGIATVHTAEKKRTGATAECRTAQSRTGRADSSWRG